jgi:glucosamine 6-phosphate synthetase-like amidotransferase/phosphosugar isomerase protein
MVLVDMQIREIRALKGTDVDQPRNLAKSLTVE